MDLRTLGFVWNIYVISNAHGINVIVFVPLKLDRMDARVIVRPILNVVAPVVAPGGRKLHQRGVDSRGA